MNDFLIHQMPKKVLSQKAWLQRMKEYARGQFAFKRGQAPPKNSKWAKIKLEIEKCQYGTKQSTIFSSQLTCTCGFHKVSMFQLLLL